MEAIKTQIPTHMTPRDLQETNERRFAKKHINGYIEQAIAENPDTMAKLDHGVTLLSDWLDQDYYESKNQRLAQVKLLDLPRLVMDIFIGVAYCQKPTLFVSITSQLAARLGFDDKKASITTVAEITAVLSSTDAFDITKDSPEASVMLQSCIPLPTSLLDAIDRSQYLPPMVCKPEPVTSNYESPYLTFNDCLILGKGNAHAQDICLDVINTQNSIELQLDTDFLSTVEEEPTFEIDSLEKHDNWMNFKRQSYAVYHLLAKQGNRFYLAHKVDKRGRLYCQGYHVTAQGSAFKKAILELANEEIVEGVPT